MHEQCPSTIWARNGLPGKPETVSQIGHDSGTQLSVGPRLLGQQLSLSSPHAYRSANGGLPLSRVKSNVISVALLDLMSTATHADPDPAAAAVAAAVAAALEAEGAAAVTPAPLSRRLPPPPVYIHAALDITSACPPCRCRGIRANPFAVTSCNWWC